MKYILCEKAARKTRNVPLFITMSEPDSPHEMTPIPNKLTIIPNHVAGVTFSFRRNAASIAVIKFPPFTIKQAEALTYRYREPID